jgi:hypothetical protein
MSVTTDATAILRMHPVNNTRLSDAIVTRSSFRGCTPITTLRRLVLGSYSDQEAITAEQMFSAPGAVTATVKASQSRAPILMAIV